MSVLSDRVLVLRLEGHRSGYIAAQLGCSRPYVTMVLRRHRKWNLRVASCPANIAEWIEAQALKHDVLPHEMARAMLVDAVNEAIDEKR